MGDGEGCIGRGGGNPPYVTFRRVVVFLRGPGQSPDLPFACCVGSLLSVGRCGRCSRWCRFRVRGAQWLVCQGCAGCDMVWGNPPPPRGLHHRGWGRLPLRHCRLETVALGVSRCSPGGGGGGNVRPTAHSRSLLLFFVVFFCIAFCIFILHCFCFLFFFLSFCIGFCSVFRFVFVFFIFFFLHSYFCRGICVRSPTSAGGCRGCAVSAPSPPPLPLAALQPRHPQGDTWGGGPGVDLVNVQHPKFQSLEEGVRFTFPDLALAGLELLP